MEICYLHKWWPLGTDGPCWARLACWSQNFCTTSALVALRRLSPGAPPLPPNFPAPIPHLRLHVHVLSSNQIAARAHH